MGVACTLLSPLPAAAQGPDAYTVAPGDTLGAIATRFGITLDALVAANGIVDPNQIAVGQVLAIPSGLDPAAIAAPSGDTAGGDSGETITTPDLPASARTDAPGSYTVAPGDTLGSISSAQAAIPPPIL